MCILHTLSKAWCLGRAVRRGQLAKTDPVNVVTTSMNGRLIISGKVWIVSRHVPSYMSIMIICSQIIDIHRATEGGFNQGYLIIQGSGKFTGSKVRVLFQNENLVAHCEDDSTDSMGKIIATTPDLISGMPMHVSSS